MVDTRLISYNFPETPTEISPGSYKFFLDGRSELQVEIMRDSFECNNELQYNMNLKRIPTFGGLFERSQLTVHVRIKTLESSKQQSEGEGPPQAMTWYPIVAFICQDSLNHLIIHEIWCYCYILFSLWPNQEYIALDLDKSLAQKRWLLPLYATRLAGPWPENLKITDIPEYLPTAALSRAEFWQGAGPLYMGAWVPALDERRLLQYDRATFTENESCLKLWELARKHIPVYERFLPEFNIFITFYMLQADTGEDDSQPVWLSPSHDLEFVCKWGDEPFSTVKAKNGLFEVSRTGHFGQNPAYKTIGLKSIIHVSSTFDA